MCGRRITMIKTILIKLWRWIEIKCNVPYTPKFNAAYIKGLIEDAANYEHCNSRKELVALVKEMDNHPNKASDEMINRLIDELLMDDDIIINETIVATVDNE